MKKIWTAIKGMLFEEKPEPTWEGSFLLGWDMRETKSEKAAK